MERGRSQPRRRDVALATWGLFVGLALLLLSAGLFGTVLGVRSELVKLPTVVSGIISAAYYAGFLLGARVALTALGRVGHIRVYSALASLLSAAMITVGLTNSSVAWIGLRFVTGLCLAGQYVVAESWLNDLATNQTRGRLLAIYSLVTSGAFGVGQILLFALDARLITGFAIASIVASLAVAPVALSEAAVAPTVQRAIPMSLRELARVVPTGVGSCVLVGIAHGALIGMAAIYAIRVGLSPAMTGVFVAAPNLGGMIFQWPISAAADELDRRAVGLIVTLLATASSVVLLVGPTRGLVPIVAITALGGFTFPLYSIAAAYTNDWIEPEHVSAAASQLVALYGIGAVLGPLMAAGMLIAFGASGFYWSLITIHAVIAAFFVYRMTAWRSPLNKLPVDELSIPARVFFVPATVVTLVRRSRSRRT